MLFTNIVAAGLLVAIPLATSTVPAWAEPDPADVADALMSITADVADGQKPLANLAPPSGTPDAGVAVATETDGVQLAIPEDPTDPISLTTDGAPSIAISIPRAAESDEAEVLHDTAVAFDQGDGSQTVVAPHADGSTQFLSVISGAEAPTEFAYGISTEQNLQLLLQPDGSVAGLDTDGSAVLAIAAPWAVDAAGRPIPTHYELRGDQLVQVVEHRSAGVAYPVVADPRLSWYPWGYAIKYTKAETKKIATAASDNQALNLACLLGGGVGGSVCAIVGYVIVDLSAKFVKGIASRGKCLQINRPWAFPGLFYEVTC